MKIVTGRQFPDEVERLLDGLPAWFGRPESNAEYVDASRTLPTWAAVADDGPLVGVCVVRHHTPVSSEIELLAVDSHLHRQGVGRLLVESVERDLASLGVKVLQVKTFGPSGESAEYELTRRFYEAIGFLPMEENHQIWGDDTPCLILVKFVPPSTAP
jgi:GNAT superfamily N-acetyltransferase